MLDRWLLEPGQDAWRRSTAGGDARLSAEWWRRLALATRGRWEPASPHPVAAGEAWMLSHPDGRQRRLTWAPDGVVLCDSQADRCERARVEGPALDRLRTELER